MAKPAVKDEPVGMQRPDLKRHLKFAREEAVQVAFGIGNDGKAIVQMDKHKQGRALERKLKEDAPDCRAYRFGTATVDANDSKTLCIKVNKAGGGLARKLVLALKGTGVSKVKLQLEDGTEFEVHEEEDTEPQEQDEPTPIARPVEPEAQAKAKAPAPTETADPSAAPVTPAGPDAKALTQDLTALVKRMLAVLGRDPTQKAVLAELATDAQASLKRGDFAQASAGIDIFREALADAETNAGQAASQRAGAKTAPNGNGAAPHRGAAVPPPPGPVPAGGVDLAQEAKAILSAVTAMVRKVLPLLGGDPAAADHIKQIVASVQAALKAGDLATARSEANRLGQLAGGVGAAVGGAAAAVGPASQNGGQAPHKHPHAPANEKARSAWTATRQTMFGEIEKLHKSFESALSGNDMLGDLAKTIRSKVDSALHVLDDGLSHALHAINNATDPAERAKHVEHAHKLVQHYQKHVSSDPTIKMLDRNPFHPIAIEQMIASTLATLAKHIR